MVDSHPRIIADWENKMTFANCLVAYIAADHQIAKLPVTPSRWQAGLDAAVEKAREISPKKVPNWKPNSNVALNEFLSLTALLGVSIPDNSYSFLTPGAAESYLRTRAATIEPYKSSAKAFLEAFRKSA